MPLKFSKRLIASEAFESAAAFDVDGDGQLDLVSGGFWYQGPDFVTRHNLGQVQREGDYYDDFSTIALDVNGNGRLDFVTGGWWGHRLIWRENPGVAGQEWTEHLIAQMGRIETTRAWDVDGDGYLELVPNTPNESLVIYRLERDAQGKGLGQFSSHTLWAGPQGHGLGFGDVSGSGRGDFVFTTGWLEAPEHRWTGEWTFHQEFDLGFESGLASVPMIVADVNGDGLSDLIVGNAHGYGLDWLEQGRDAGGGRTWTRHPIDPFCSQYHDLRWADLDGDGQMELITGKRYLAHPGDVDAGNGDELGIYYFKWTGAGFVKHFIAHGPLGVWAGCGITFDLADLRGTGRLDVIAPGKDGLHIFFNEGL